MQVYVVHEQHGICGVYDSLLAVKQDFLSVNELWEDFVDMSEEDYIEFLYQQKLCLCKEEVFSFNFDNKETPIRAKATTSIIVQML